MEHHGNIKRFCFALDIESYNSLCVPKSTPTIGKSDRELLGIHQFEVYTNTFFAFLILDLDSNTSLSGFRKKITQQDGKIAKYCLIQILNGLTMDTPLEQIFGTPPLETNMVKPSDTYKRTVMTLELKANEELLEAYKKVHEPGLVWPEIISNMKAIGVKDMEIYLYGYQAFLIMDTHLDFDMEKDGERWANMPREKEWQAYVAKFQKIDPKSKTVEKWKTMILAE
ncbi:L-rhamnose mutarotase [Flagellimonas sp.]|uniref:L-rhamnose mutarotase n=1 Tax=Flagellimonas sp. TaxID=2058762 RepID=UPI003B501FA3